MEKHRFPLMSFVLILLVLQAGLLPAQQSMKRPTLILSLEESIARALQENNQMQASNFSLLRAKWDRANAWLQFLPTASFNSRVMRIDERSFAERDFRRYLPPEVANLMPQTVFQQSFYSSIEVTMPLFNAALLNNLSIARAGYRAAKEMNKSTRENTIFQVVSAYLNVLKSQAILALQQEYLELSEKNVAKADRLFKAGRYSKTEVMRWEVDAAQQRSTVAEWESYVRSHKIDLKRLLNMNMAQNVGVEDTVPEALIKEQEKLEAFSDNEILKLINLPEAQLIAANAALNAARSNSETSKYVYRNSYAAYLPNLSASYSHGWRENSTIALDDYSPKTVLVNLSIPIFTSFKNYSTVKSSYYAYKESEALFRDQVQNTQFVLTQVANALINLKTRNALAKASADFNEHNYRIVEQQKEQGILSNIDFVDAKLNLQNAQLNLIHGQYDYIAAMVELYYYLGRIEQIINQ